MHDHLPPVGSAVYHAYIGQASEDVHVDEASSALPDISALLPPALAATLWQEERASLHSAVSAPSTPTTAAFRARADSAIPIAPWKDLMPIALLVTGEWGPPAGALFIAGLTSRPAGRRLSVLNASPARGAEAATPEAPTAAMARGGSFWVRMARLEARLEALQTAAAARYAHNAGPATSPTRYAAVKRQIASLSKSLKSLPRTRAASRRSREAQLKSLRATLKTLTPKARPDRPTARPWLTEIARMLVAVRFIRAQEDTDHLSLTDTAGHPLGVAWRVVASGNGKLPFAAYSELPMVTCPGAGACAVKYSASGRAADRKDHRGYCYSFKSWRTPAAFTRQFLTTLANYFDREIAIVAGGGAPAGDEPRRVEAAVRGRASRRWPGFVARATLTLTAPVRANHRKSFLRLFVDGDVGTTDAVLAWMAMCHEIGAGGRLIEDGRGHVEVYGYTKAWAQFVDADRRFLRTDHQRELDAVAVTNELPRVWGGWPENYAVNMSNASIYHDPKLPEARLVREAMEQLPTTRGYFDAVPLSNYLPMLAEAKVEEVEHRVRALAASGKTHFPFDARRIQDFLLIERARTLHEIEALLGPIFPRRRVARIGPPTVEELEDARRTALRVYLTRLLAQVDFGARARLELEKDVRGYEAKYLVKREAQLRHHLQRVLEGRRVAASLGLSAKPSKALYNKARALVMHEALWTFGLGGACPLICGNCSDRVDATLERPGDHRCASKTTFRGKHIYIGLH